MYTSSSRPGAWFVAAVLCVLVAACTSEPSVADDPEGALRHAFTTMAADDGVELRAGLDGEATGALLGAAGVDEAARSLLAGSTLHVHSSVDRAAHARLVPSDGAAAETRVALVRVVDGLEAMGLGRLADVVADGGWVRIATPPSPTDETAGDRIARGLASAGGRLLDASDAVEHVGADGGTDHVRVLAGATSIRHFLDEVVHVVAATGEGDPRGPGASADGAGRPSDVAVDAWLSDGRLTRLEVDLVALDLEVGASSPLVLWAEFAELGEFDIPDDAPAFALRALLGDVMAAAGGRAGSGEAGLGGQNATAGTDEPAADDQQAAGEPGDDVTSEPAPAPVEPPVFEEGGVLDDAFGDEDPFADDVEFDCVTDDELQALEDALGPEARDEVEDLIEQGHLHRCR